MADVQVSFGANIQELIDGVDGIRGLLGGLAAALGAAFSVEGIENFIASMAELGSHIDRTSKILGISTSEVQELGVVAKATGGDAGSLTHAIGLLQRNLETAQSGIGPTAQALKALGLNAKELAALPIPEQVAKIADAFNKYADGGRKAALANELVRGGAETLLPAIEGGSAGFNKLKDAAVEAGAVMTSQTVKSLDDLSVKSGLAKASLTALGGTLVAITPGLGTFLDGVATTAGHLTALASTGNLAEYTLGYLDEVVDNLGYRFVALGHAIGNLSTLNFAHLASDWARDEASLLANAKTEGADLDAILNRSIESYKKLLAATKTDNRPQAPESGAPDKSAITAQLEEYQTESKLADEAYKQTQEHLAAEVKLHELTYDQETAKLLDALEDRYGMELAANAAEAAVGGQTVAQYQKIADEKRLIDQKYAADHQKIVDQQLEKDTQSWQNIVQPIEGAFNSQLRGLLSGTETWAQASKKIFGDLVIAVIEGFEKIALQWAVTQLAMAVGGPSAAAATALKDIVSSAAAVGAEVTAQLTPAIGYPAALAAGTAAEAGVVGSFATQAVPSLDVGTDYVTRGGLAVIHEGEAIRPAQSSGPYTGANSGGSGDNHFHFHGSVIGTQQWLQQAKGQLAAAVQSKQNLSPSMAW